MIAKYKKIKRRQFGQKNLTRTLIVLLFLSIAGFLVVANLRIRPHWLELEKKLAELKKQAEILQEKNEALKAGLQQTQSDVYWEARLREQGYIKPGEQAIVVYPEETKEEVKNTEGTTTEKNFWQDWLNWFWQH